MGVRGGRGVEKGKDQRVDRSTIVDPNSPEGMRGRFVFLDRLVAATEMRLDQTEKGLAGVSVLNQPELMVDRLALKTTLEAISPVVHERNFLRQLLVNNQI
jgi:hypothetical protein